MPVNPNFQYLRHLFNGGWATDFGPTTDVGPDGANVVRVPYLLQADNCFYELDGGPHKEYGTTALYATALESGATIKGLYDFWRQGSSGSPQQHRVMAIGTKVYKDDGNETFSEIASGLTEGAVPHFSQFDDLLIFANDAVADTPKSWDGTTWQDLSSDAPNFAFSVVHAGKLFAAGVDASPSTLFYSASFDPEDWTSESSSGAVGIQIDPNDGDRITALASYKGVLIIFKGPHKGSIHILSGTSFADFTLKKLRQGIGAVWQNTVSTYGDDLAFLWSDGHVYSLSATERFGDFREAAQLTRPVASWIDDHANFSRLKHAWLVNWPARGMMLFSFPIDAATDPSFIMMLSYRLGDMRLAPWPGFDDYTALALVIDPDDNDRPRIMGGSDDGKVWKFGHSTRSLKDSDAITFRVTTPYFNYANPMVLKTISHGALAIAPKNDGDLTFGWTRDDNAQQTRDVAQGGTDVLGPADENQFTLGTSALGGASFVDRFMDLNTGGQFRSIQYQVTNAAAGEDVELHGIAAAIQINGPSWEN